MTPKFTMKNRTAFTLIELLVVIAIIAILAAILFPVFATAREKARQSACLSNLKQIGLAVVQYQQDYDETNPSGADWHDNGCGWAGQVYPYVKSAGAYLCPSDTSTVNAVCSYGYNSSFVYASGTAYNSPPVGLALSKFTMPSKTVMFFEMVNSGSATTPNVYSISGQQYQAGADIVPIAPGNTVHFVGNSPSGNGLGDVTQDPWDYSWNYSTTPHVQYATGYLATDGWTRSAAKLAQNFSGPSGRHNLGSNFVMTDGHVKWITPELVMAGRQRGSFDCSHNSQAYAYSPDCATYTFSATFAAY